MGQPVTIDHDHDNVVEMPLAKKSKTDLAKIGADDDAAVERAAKELGCPEITTKKFNAYDKFGKRVGILSRAIAQSTLMQTINHVQRGIDRMDKLLKELEKSNQEDPGIIELTAQVLHEKHVYVKELGGLSKKMMQASEVEAARSEPTNRPFASNQPVVLANHVTVNPTKE